MNAEITKMLNASLAVHVEDEQSWLPHDRRGRWVVIEPGAGRYLTDSPRRVRKNVDRVSRRRARRFSSLSRARAFARQVDGAIHHWRRTPPGGGIWKRESPWEQARLTAAHGFWLPSTIGNPQETK